MAYFSNVENKTEVKSLILQDLKDLGIKVPKQKKTQSQENKEGSTGVFGSALSSLPCVDTDDCDQVPRFLTDAFACVRKAIETEGLFRKNGSLARQKVLKDAIDRGESVQDSHVFDVTSLIKRFFRELPDCLFTSWLYDSFMQAGLIETEDERTKALTLLCLLLPADNLSSLRFTMTSLLAIAEKSEMNKMDVSNLAVCLTPNILRTEKQDNGQLQTQTSIVEFFIRGSWNIGIVSDELAERAQLMSSISISCDELDGSESRSKKKKRRSGSLQGLVSNIKESLGKWRKSSSRQSLTSESMNMHLNNISAMDVEDDPTGGFVNATPKLMRKRKADDEMAPFSATKRKAILQQISTPYTPASVMRNSKKTADPVQKFDISPTIQFSNDNRVPVFTGTPGSRKIASPKKKSKYASPSATRKRMETPKSPSVKSKRTGFLRRLSGGNKNTSQNECSPIIGSRLAGPIPMEFETPSATDKLGKKKNSMFKSHKKHPSSPARIIGPPTDGSSSFVSNSAMETSVSSVSRSANDSVVIENMAAANANHLSDLDLARKLKHDLMCASPAVKTSVIKNVSAVEQHRPSRPHKRALSADRAALKRGQPNTVHNGLRPASPMNLKSQQRASSLIRKGSFNKCDISLPVSVTLPENKNLSSSSVIPAGASAKTLLEKLKKEKQSRIETPHIQNTNMASFNSAYSADEPVLNESCIEQCDEHQLSGNMQTSNTEHASVQKEEVMDEEVFKVPACVDKPVDASAVESLDSSLNSTSSSDASIITVIDRFGPVSSFPRTSSRISSCADKTSSGSLQSLKETQSQPGTVETKPKLLQQSSLDSVDSGIASMTGSSESLNIQPMVTENSSDVSEPKKKAVSVENLQTSSAQINRPVRRAQSLYDKRRNSEVMLQISPEMHNMLARSGKIDEDPSSVYMDTDEGNFVRVPSFRLQLPQNMSPEKPVHESVVNLHEVRKVSSNVEVFAPTTELPCGTNKPVHESVLNLQNVAKVTANVEIFNQIEEEDMQSLAEKRTSPHRFPHSKLRNRQSPVRVPTIFARTDLEAVKFRQLARNAVKRKGSISRKPNIPIGTGLVKSDSVESALTRLQKEQAADMLVTEPKHATAPEIFQKSLQQARVRRLSKSHSEEMEMLGTEYRHQSNLTEQQEVVEDEVKEEPTTAQQTSTEEDTKVENKVLSSLQKEMLNVLLKKEVDLSHDEGSLKSLQDTIDDMCTPLSNKIVKNCDILSKTPNRYSSTSKLPSPTVSTAEQAEVVAATPNEKAVVRKRRRRSAPGASQYMSREREVDMAEVRKSLMSNAPAVEPTPQPIVATPNEPFLEYYNQLKKTEVTTPRAPMPAKDTRQPLKDCNSARLAVHDSAMKPVMATPVIKAGLITRDLTKLRTPGGFTPRSVRPGRTLQVTPAGNRYRSPVKTLKRLNSPGSPRSPRNTRSPRRYPSSPIRPKQTASKSDLSPIPSHVRNDFEMY